MHKNSAFTLVEILVASVIFALVIVGLLSVFSSGNRHIVHTRERMTGTELGKFFVDPFQMDVSQETWDQAGNQLNVSAVPVNLTPTPHKINNREFSATYTVADGDPLSANYDANLASTDLRRVTTKVTWNEPQP